MLSRWRSSIYQQEYVLFERRVILAGLTHEESRIRCWFWMGQVSRVLQVFVAIFWAALLLGFASLLGPARAASKPAFRLAGRVVTKRGSTLVAAAARAAATDSIVFTVTTPNHLAIRIKHAQVFESC